MNKVFSVVILLVTTFSATANADLVQCSSEDYYQGASKVKQAFVGVIESATRLNSSAMLLAGKLAFTAPTLQKEKTVLVNNKKFISLVGEKEYANGSPVVESILLEDGFLTKDTFQVIIKNQVVTYSLKCFIPRAQI